MCKKIMRVHAISMCHTQSHFARAAIAQLGERQTEDLKVPGSIPGLGTHSYAVIMLHQSAVDIQVLVWPNG